MCGQRINAFSVAPLIYSPLEIQSSHIDSRYLFNMQLQYLRSYNMYTQCSHSVGRKLCCVMCRISREHSLLMFPPSLLGLYYCFLQHQAGRGLAWLVLSPPTSLTPQTGSWNFWIRATPRTSVQNSTCLMLQWKGI